MTSHLTQADNGSTNTFSSTRVNPPRNQNDIPSSISIQNDIPSSISIHPRFGTSEDSASSLGHSISPTGLNAEISVVGSHENQDLPPHYPPVLVFNSCFESGNLNAAYATGPYTYTLMLQTDHFTNRHTQWFYFSVSNMVSGVPYTFTISNFLKKTSLYSKGMQVVVLSDRGSIRSGVGWHRGGSDISYCKNTGPSGTASDGTYSLRWTYVFSDDNDIVYFAYSYPYTYSDLQEYLSVIRRDPERSLLCRMHVLCHTLAGNVCNLLTITQPGASPRYVFGGWRSIFRGLILFYLGLIAYLCIVYLTYC